MTWSEIKQAVEQTGIKEDDEILEIHCETNGGDHKLHPVRLGRFIKLDESQTLESQRREAAGCSA